MLFDLNTIAISIIIPTLEREAQLEQLLDFLGTQIPTNIEIVIVDDSKLRSTIDFGEFNFAIHYIFRGRKLGVSSARNEGASVASGKYLIFLDDDDRFTADWLVDFISKLDDEPDLVFCNMKLIASNGKVSTVSAFQNNRRIVIPGAWMIKKEVFDQAGGYDERLKFAENTELFFKLDHLTLKKKYLDSENFIYNQSPDGGSKNLQNMLDSLRIILEKHDSYLNAHVKHLYHQKIGVIEMRFGNFGKARKNLWKSLYFKPLKLSTLFRLGIAYFPLVARRIYSLKIRKA